MFLIFESVYIFTANLKPFNLISLLRGFGVLGFRIEGLGPGGQALGCLGFRV